jgi:hypothetical protein
MHGEMVKFAVSTVQCSRTDDDMCGVAVKGMGILGVSVRKMKGLTVKMETDTGW